MRFKLGRNAQSVRNVDFLLLVLLSLLSFVTAQEPEQPDPSSLALSYRDINTYDLHDVLLLSTLDGSLQARARDSGQVLWTLEGPQLVEVQQTAARSSPSQATSESKVMWLAEPSESGGLYYFTPEGGVERIPASIQELVQKAPFGMVGNVVYTGSRQSTLYALDLYTGEILQVFGSYIEFTNPNSDVDPTRVIMIGRTEYTLDMHEQLGSPGWRVRISLWTPNSRDHDLEGQYTAPQDSLYITPLNNHTVMALSENDMRPQRWISEVSSLLVDVFDILKSQLDGSLAMVHQPTLKFSGSSTDWDLYVSETGNGSPVVVRGPRYSALMSSALRSEYCDGKGNSIAGVHPLWCQNKRHVPSKVPPAMPLLPAPVSPDVTTYPGLPEPRKEPIGRIDEPIPNKFSSWKHTAKNWGLTLVVLFALLSIASSKGWLPIGLNVFRSIDEQGSNKQANSYEPKKRRRGTRGGKRTSNKKDGKPLSLISDSKAPITVSDVVLGYGSHGTTVLKGRFEDRDVAVKRMLLEFYDVASQEVDILRESDDHPNVVRYFCKYQTDQFLYIALELCPGTLEDLVRGSHQFSILYDPLDSLRQIMLGLQHLHNLQIVHRDIKPQNILVALPNSRSKNRKPLTPSMGVRYLISDFGLCKKLEGEQSSFLPTMADSVAGTAGWAAPEISSHNQADRLRLTRAVDIFSMGCLFYYVLSGGKHPFGDAHMRQVNIQQRRAPQLESGDLMTPEAMDLVPSMLQLDPQMRPNTHQILKHPMFWSDQKKLDFLVKVSDRLEHESREEKSDLIERLEAHSWNVLGKDWHIAFPTLFIENLGKYRRYHGDRILDLLRALRNKLHHYNDFSDELKDCVGSIPSGYLTFFTDRFPLLLVTVYHYAEVEFKEEEAFIPFF